MAAKDDIEALFKAHYPRLYRLAVAIVHDEDTARDVVHDVFVSLLDGGRDIRVAGDYLSRAVRNRCLNHVRDCEIHQRIKCRYFLDNDEYDTEDWPDEGTIALIHRFIESDISPQARRVMELRFSEGLPFARIASLLGISETAVYRHMRNALSIIRKKLNENGQV